MDIKARFFELAAQRLSLRPGDLERLRRCVATEPVNANGIKFRLLILAQLGLGSISGPTQHDDAMLKMIDEWAAANNSAPAVPLAGEQGGRLHVEAMGLRPADVVSLLVTRGRKVPAELRDMIDPAPVVVSPPRPLPAANDARPVEHWKMRVQAEAAVEWKRLRAIGCNPTRASIRPHLLKWCRENNIKTPTHLNPSDGYLRTHVLSGKHWTPPID